MRALLPGAQFGDCFRITVDDAINARQAAERMFLRQRGWISALMKLRNIMVTPFGLKRPTHRKALTRESIGPFPVISETPQRLVAGFDDRHLDFRIVVDVSGDVPGQEVSATTLVKTNNLLGRIYLTIIMPFHRIIVPAMLRNI
ncbi:hypothetical protein CSIRO_1162 [Bradyrhizobiaceae bacterium SG-6C]|nr:hypothetical protein CSIRO_1162 [Bradyrhizobiaceae bacterium SG-6C]